MFEPGTHQAAGLQGAALSGSALLMPLAEQAKERGIHVYHLNIGQPDLETPPAMRDRLRLLENEKVYAYSPSGGTPEYLESLVEYYAGFGIRLALDQILVVDVVEGDGEQAAVLAELDLGRPGLGHCLQFQALT